MLEATYVGGYYISWRLLHMLEATYTYVGGYYISWRLLHKFEATAYVGGN